MVRVTAVLLIVMFVTLPFGFYRAYTRKLSLRWFLAIHVPIPAIFLLRTSAGYSYWFIPWLFVGAVSGQILGARLFSPASIIAVDPSASRRAAATRFGADHVVAPSEAKELVDLRTGGLGADVTIEAVGVPEAFEQCCELVRPGGHVANVGVHGQPVTLHLETLWIKDVTITTGLVDTSSTPTLLSLVESGQIDPTVFTTHAFALDQAMEAYETFAHADATDALKVALRA